MQQLRLVRLTGKKVSPLLTSLVSKAYDGRFDPLEIKHFGMIPENKKRYWKKVICKYKKRFRKKHDFWKQWDLLKNMICENNKRSRQNIIVIITAWLNPEMLGSVGGDLWFHPTGSTFIKHDLILFSIKIHSKLHWKLKKIFINRKNYFLKLFSVFGCLMFIQVLSLLGLHFKTSQFPGKDFSNPDCR